ncbi:hypothetical protein [Pontibacter virosus]|uniref:Uncharacterized protein n=1 Tax=Pontibacter virosus TaxID=1765052 RepID=A0A2U1B0L3_9BACT|nr:hypothetical protein [Pontibacter virosus]PVY42215.1 hypothetical protein C8E01_10381 [Pontibacter virosus]
MPIKNPYCNFEPGQGSIRRLTCEAWMLQEEKVLKTDKWIGGHSKLTIFKCCKCGNYWKIGEVFDSHHGYSKEAIKPGETMWLDGEVVSFSLHELLD